MTVARQSYTFHSSGKESVPSDQTDEVWEKGVIKSNCGYNLAVERQTRDREYIIKPWDIRWRLIVVKTFGAGRGAI